MPSSVGRRLPIGCALLQHAQDKEDQPRQAKSEDGGPEGPQADSHSDTRRKPHRRRGREPLDPLLVLQFENDPRSHKTDPDGDALNDAR